MTAIQLALFSPSTLPPAPCPVCEGDELAPAGRETCGELCDRVLAARRRHPDPSVRSLALTVYDLLHFFGRAPFGYDEWRWVMAKHSSEDAAARQWERTKARLRIHKVPHQLQPHPYLPTVCVVLGSDTRDWTQEVLG